MINFNSNKITQILAFFFLNPKRRLYLKELANILEIDNGNLSRYLKSLVEEGILKVEIEGKQKYFLLDSSYPFLKNLKKMLTGSVSPEVLIKKALAPIKGLERAYLFGSYASGKLKENSDLDILLIGSHDSIEVREVLASLQRRLGREINIIDYSVEEYEKRLKEKDDFLDRVFHESMLTLK